jgi:hypothetical protein
MNYPEIPDHWRKIMWIYEVGHYNTTGEKVVDYADICATEDGAIYAASCAEMQLAEDGYWGCHWSNWRECSD